MNSAKSSYKYLQLLLQLRSISFSFVPGWPSVDFPECSRVVWVDGTNKAEIDTAVDSLSNQVNEKEADWWIDLCKPVEAVREAMRQS